MRIELASLERGRGSFNHRYSPGELTLDDDRLCVTTPPVVSGEIRQKGPGLRVTGKVTGRVQVACDRCLKAVEVGVDSKFEVDYVTAEAYQAQQEAELTEADLDLSIYDGETLDVDELVKEELLLAVPDHVVCSAACKGMCAVCGADKNLVDCDCETRQVDPRWAGLNELVNRKS